MGVISVTAHEHFQDEVIRRTKEKRKASEFVSGIGISMTNYQGRNQHVLSKLEFQPMKLLTIEPSRPTEVRLNFLWQCSCFLVHQTQTGLD